MYFGWAGCWWWWLSDLLDEALIQVDLCGPNTSFLKMSISALRKTCKKSCLFTLEHQWIDWMEHCSCCFVVVICSQCYHTIKYQGNISCPILRWFSWRLLITETIDLLCTNRWLTSWQDVKELIFSRSTLDKQYWWDRSPSRAAEHRNMTPGPPRSLQAAFCTLIQSPHRVTRGGKPSLSFDRMGTSRPWPRGWARVDGNVYTIWRIPCPRWWFRGSISSCLAFRTSFQSTSCAVVISSMLVFLFEANSNPLYD